MISNESHINNELDDFKSIWKNQKQVQSYDKNQIFEMIHKKSVNSVQWLFIISIIELFLGLILSIWTLFSGKHFFSKNALEMVGQKSLEKFESFSHLGLIGSLIFMFIIFIYYRKISSNLSVKGLINNIINFRKTVIWFLVIWMCFITALFSPIYFQMGREAYFHKVAGENLPADQINHTANSVGWGITIFFILLIFVVCGIYYLIIYGFFLRRLNKNLKELKKMDM
jgi:hypothetical protein